MVEWQFRCITLPFKALLDKKVHLRLRNNGENLLVFISKFFILFLTLYFHCILEEDLKGVTAYVS